MPVNPFNKANPDKTLFEAKRIKLARNDPRLQRKWQEKFYNLLVQMNPKVDRAFALFSYSGWSDSGQFLVADYGDKADPQLTYVAPGQTKHKTKNIAIDDFKEFVKKINHFKKLSDLESQVFDGTQFEFVYYEMKGSKLSVTKRVFMNNPGVSPNSGEYFRIVKQFLDLKN